MGDRLPQVKPRELIRALERLGFIVRRTAGSHVTLRHPISGKIVTVPEHAGDIKRGLLFGILKQADINREDFLRTL